MKIVVFVKQTADTEAKVRPEVGGQKLADLGKQIINPYDEHAIEEALKLKQSLSASEVVLMTFGPSQAKERLLKGLAMGADRGVLIDNIGLEALDSSMTAKVLAKAVKEEEDVKLILAGKQAIDDDNMHVAQMCAEELSWPHVNVVSKIEVQAGGLKVQREAEASQLEVYELSLPAVVGAHKSLNNPRYASLPGIMKAKKKPFDLKTVSDLGLSAEELKSSNLVEVKAYTQPAEKAQGKLFQDKPLEEMVSEVASLLRDEAKVL